jgi:FOG: PKD repeat
MKLPYFIFVTLLIIITSCSKDNILPPLNAKFNLGDSLLKIDEPLIVTNVSSKDASHYLWDFGDGSTSDQQNPNHSYSTSGLYEVTLSVSNSLNETKSFKKMIRVGDLYFNELTVNKINTLKWFDPSHSWDEDSIGASALPDLFFEIKSEQGKTLYTSNVIYNVNNDRLPLQFVIPDIKINNPYGFGFGILLNDQDSKQYETIISNQLSGRQTSTNYDKQTHTGKITVSFAGNEISAKYYVK